ncbi:hypothetical protein LIER_04728 [Lithospermum erythrorhizon]|uniref:Uncharacterized protein n=1 Tax=Lithospermum erythrorhizon TaxID=34254 RepID=A0AAV3P2H2_LITER
MEVESFDTLSDPITSHRVDFDMGPLSLQEELSTSFPPKAPVATLTVQSSAPTPEKVTRRRKGKQPLEETLQGEGNELLSTYSGKYLATPFQLPNLQAANGVHILARRLDYLARVNAHLGYQLEAKKKSLGAKTTLLKGLDSELTSLKKSTETLSKIAEERAKRVEDLTKSWPRRKKLPRHGTLRGPNLWLRGMPHRLIARSWSWLTSLMLPRRLNLWNMQRKKEMRLWHLSHQPVFSSRTKKLWEFLNSPSYASKIHSECAKYFSALALDHKGRFLYLTTLFDEEKARNPD